MKRNQTFTSYAAQMLRIYAQRWGDADERSRELADEISRLKTRYRREIFNLELEQGKAQQERRSIELAIIRLINHDGK